MDISVGAEAIVSKTQEIMANLEVLKNQVEGVRAVAGHLVAQQPAASSDPFMSALTVFVLACIVGYYVVWNVTPALHSPLMAVTNAISSVVILGAVVTLGSDMSTFTSSALAFVAAVLASINIFGGFGMTHRMLSMFKKRK